MYFQEAQKTRRIAMASEINVLCVLQGWWCGRDGVGGVAEVPQDVGCGRHPSPGRSLLPLPPHCPLTPHHTLG